MTILCSLGPRNAASHTDKLTTAIRIPRLIEKLIAKLIAQQITMHINAWAAEGQAQGSDQQVYIKGHFNDHF